MDDIRDPEGQGTDFAASAAKLYGPGGGGVDSYGPNYGQETGGGVELHPLAFPERKGSPETLQIKPETQDKPASGDEPVSDEALTQMGIDKADIDAFKPIAGKLGMEEAGKLMELHQKALDRQAGELSAMNETWLYELNTEYGNGLEAAADDVNGLLKKYDTGGQLVALLKKTGTQNAAPLFRLLHNVSRDLNRYGRR